MSKNTVVMGVLVDDLHEISFIEVCEQQGLPEDDLLEMLEYGLFPEFKTPSKQVTFDMLMLDRIKSANRLRQDLGINSPGVVLALELLDELELIKSELRILQRLKHKG